MFIYRSPELRDHDGLGSPRYKRLADFTKGLFPSDVSRTLPDPLMMFGEAELTIWETR